jgi:hypothetical protein
MTDFLTIAGTPYPVQTGGATRAASQFTGEKARAFNNALLSTRGQEKRQWSFVIGPVSIAADAALRAAVANDAVVPVNGDAIGGAVNSMVEVTEGGYTPNALSHMRVVHVLIDEV